MLRTTTLDVQRLREDFPILRRKVHGKPLVYLDSAATSQRPRQVIDAVVRFYSEYNANIHRAVHQLGAEATEAFEGARLAIARFIGAAAPQELVLVRNATEAINLVAYAWGRANIRAGDRLVLTKMEHHSNIVPWQLLARATGATLHYVDIDEDGLLRPDQVEAQLAEHPKLVCVTHASNVLGSINDVRHITAKAHAVGARVLVDAAQAVPHMPVSVRELDCDFLAFTGHKMLGPTGIGVLYGRRQLLDEMPPFLGGGDMIREVHLHEATWNEVPWKFEAGTSNIAGGIGLGEAVRYLAGLGMPHVREHEQALVKYALDALGRIPGVTVYGPSDATRRAGILTFNIADVHPHDVASILDEQGIAIRSGHHCAQPLMERLGVDATCRASFYVYTTFEEIDTLANGVRRVKEVFHV
jgi:cysteine desulfurase/selenocysteine lyase